MAAPKGGMWSVKRSKARKLLYAGKLDEAESLLVQVCSHRPDDGEAWTLRGTIHGVRGQYDEVMACARRAIEVSPRNAMAYSHLGSALAARGRVGEAIAALERATKIAPDNPDILSNLGSFLILAERFKDAAVYFSRALEISPDHLEANHGLGQVLAALGLHEKAMVAEQRAAKIDPNNYQVLCGLARACTASSRFDMAIDCYKQALRVAKNPVEPLCEMAWVEVFVGRFDSALKHLDEAQRHARTVQDHAVVRSWQADLYHRQGDSQRSYDLIHGMIAKGIVPAHAVEVYASICRDFGDCEEVLQVGKRMLSAAKMEPMDQAAIHFALGKVLRGLGRYDDAFFHYRQGNDLTPHRFKRAPCRAVTDGLIEGYSREAIARLPRARNGSDRPVFIIGMPRSGTSLIEQILACHPDVYGAGELTDITDLKNRAVAQLGGPIYANLAALSQEMVDEWSTDYLRRLDALSDSAVRVTDKMPQNFLHLGLIAQLFPGVRVIHCTRDPRDTCLSIYFQRFNQGHPYAWDLQDMAFYYREYQRLMHHWQGVLEIDMIEVNYETVVGNLEQEARRMVAFLGLEWDERCLHFHESDRMVVTSSYDQVRRPLYNTSVGKWKLYERHLEPLLRELGMNGAQ